MIRKDSLKQLRDKVYKQLEGAEYSILIIEGILLYHDYEIRRKLSDKLFVRLDHEEARRKRLSRPSYGDEVKEDEFWRTHDYFKRMVWRNYVEQHADLFGDGNVEGGVDRTIFNECGSGADLELGGGHRDKSIEAAYEPAVG